MYYEAQLQLLRNTFRKCHIQTVLAHLSLPFRAYPELNPYSNLPEHIQPSHSLQDFVPKLQPETIYRLSDHFGFRYLCLMLPELTNELCLIIGPFLNNIPTKQQIMEWSETRNITPQQQRHLERLYTDVPLLPENSHLFVLLDAFAEHLWGHDNYASEDISFHISDSFNQIKASSDEKDALQDMKIMELRYDYENQLMDAVSKGQTHKADVLLGGLSSFSLEQRVSDPVKNAKNYCIIMNTLLRKAAERGGVHPLYLDNASSAFALQIEQLLTVDAATALMTQMYRTYCKLVRQHTMQHYSPAIQKALICIDADLSGPISLNSLADTLNISSSYLSSLFKKETGQTLTDYINTKRMDLAKHLLKTTQLQIQTVSQHCGIMDVQYFSKVFKRSTGLSPKQYRDSRYP